jgi:hypothetical protein
MLRRDHKLHYGLAGLIASWAILIERKPRRAELALYVLPRAADSLYQILVEHKLLARVPRGEAALFAASMAVLMYFFERRAVEGPGARAPAAHQEGKGKGRRVGGRPVDGSTGSAGPAASTGGSGGAGASAQDAPTPAANGSSGGDATHDGHAATALPPGAGAQPAPTAAARQSEDAMPSLLRAILRTFIPAEPQAHAHSAAAASGALPALGARDGPGESTSAALSAVSSAHSG